ncbi:DUF6134 family protein [Telmatospirillum siberiense]|uniref:DUF6134 family protein n=1 Tax=Telmatospirillum siberiense TaxID=382514 RepID=UPI0011AF253A|nr:DUF6134 family protein [Telmatospirillum siberiense]
MGKVLKVSAMIAGLAAFAWSVPGAAEDLGPPGSGRIDFNIVRQGDVIGHYHSDFLTRSDRVLEVRTNVSAKVSIGPVRIYDFSHSAVETWRDGLLVGLVSETNDDGTIHRLRAEPIGQTLSILVDGKSETTRADAVPSSLWHRRMLDGARPIFDIEDGELFQTQTRCESPFPPPSPMPSVCEITGSLVRTLRFDPQGVLIEVSFPVEDGSKVTYRPN